MKRWIEPAKSVLIVALLASSLVLSARLWLSPVAANAVREGYRVPYTAPGMSADLHWADVLQPVNLLVFLPSRDPGLIDPRSEYGRFLWLAVRGVAAAVPAEALEPVSADRVDRWRRDAVQGDGMGIEAALPMGVRLSLWRQLWAAALGPEPPQPGAQVGARDEELDSSLDGPADQVVILFADGEARVLFQLERGYLGARIAVPAARGAGAGGSGGDGAGGDTGSAGGNSSESVGGGTGSAGGRGDETGRYLDSLRQLLQLMASLEPSQEPVEPVQSAPGLAVAPDVYAPLGGRDLPLLRYGPASLPWERLARSFFGSATVPRRVAAGDVVLYTDGRGSLTIRPDEGLAEYKAPPMPSLPDRPAPTPAEALAAAVAFGAEHGGWPDAGDVVLTSVTPVVARGSLSSPQVLGYRFGFMRRIDGYLLADRHLAVVEVEARGVVSWRRRFIASNRADRDGTVAIPIISASEAVKLAGTLDFDELAESARLVDAAGLVYIRHDRDRQRPAWQLNLHDGTVVWVSAWPGGDIQIRSPAR